MATQLKQASQAILIVAAILLVANHLTPESVLSLLIAIIAELRR